MTTTVKRRLNFTPRTSKRRKPAPMRMMRPIAEVKHYTQTGLENITGTSFASQNIVERMNRGTDNDEFVGNRLRVLRIRVRYDYTALSTVTQAIRLVVGIPRGSGVGTVSQNTPLDHSLYRTLHDETINIDPSQLAGTFDVVGPFNLYLPDSPSTSGVFGVPFITLYANNQAVNAAALTGFELWYTDS